MISVVIPLYNKAGQVARTLRSVLGQTFDRFEVVIVDDGSTDGSLEVVQSVYDERIRIVSQRNAGVSAARNRGVAEARYDLIAFLDADDEWMPTYLETQYNLYRKYPDCSVFACNYEFHGSDGRVTPTMFRNLTFVGEDGILDNYFEVAVCSHPPISSISVMVRKNAIEAVGGFPVGVTLGEDIVTWAKLACKYKIAFSRSVMAVYEFRTQKQLVTPRRAPDKDDVVGRQLGELFQVNKDILCLAEYVALWHKMRMVTFVRLGMRKDANIEYKKIKQYGKCSKKVLFWHYLSYLPKCAIRFVLFQIAKIR